MMVEVGDSEGGVGARNNDSCGIVAFVWTDTIVRFNPLAMASSTVLLPATDVEIFVTSVVVFPSPFKMIDTVLFKTISTKLLVWLRTLVVLDMGIRLVAFVVELTVDDDVGLLVGDIDGDDVFLVGE